AHAGDEVARIRVQGKAWRSDAAPAAGGAVSPAARLADVVRRVLCARRAPVAAGADPEAARGRRERAVAAADEPGSRSSAAFRPRAVLRVPFHSARRAHRDWRVVAPPSHRRVLPAGVAGQRAAGLFAVASCVASGFSRTISYAASGFSRTIS